MKNLNEKDKYKKMKDNLKSENEKSLSKDTSCKVAYKIMRLNSIKSKS